MNTNGLKAERVAALRAVLAERMRLAGLKADDLTGGADGPFYKAFGQAEAFTDAIELLDAACAATPDASVRVIERAVDWYGDIPEPSRAILNLRDAVADYICDDLLERLHNGTIDGGDPAPFTLNAEERYVVEEMIDAYMSSHTRVVQDGVIVALNNRLAAAKNVGETVSPESDKDFADRVHHPIDTEYQRGYREGCDDTAAAFVAGPEGVGLEPESDALNPVVP